MAKIIFGAFVTGIRGKIGGTLFTKNGSGVSAGKVETTAKKAKPKGMAQAAQIGAAARMWRQMDQNTRDSFITTALNYPRTNSLGQTYYLNGFQLFSSWQANLHTLNLPVSDSFYDPANPLYNVNTITNLAIEFSYADGITTTFDSDSVNPDTWLKIFASRPVSAGKSTVSGAYKLIGIINDGVLTPVITTQEYFDLFGYVAEGDTVFFKVDVANSLSGFQIRLVNDLKVTVVT